MRSTARLNAARAVAVVDASLTLARRALCGERFWRPHRTHYYQRLVQSGLGHGPTLKFEIVLMLVCASGALLGQMFAPEFEWVVVAGFAVAYIGLVLALERYLRARSEEGPAAKPT